MYVLKAHYDLVCCSSFIETPNEHTNNETLNKHTHTHKQTCNFPNYKTRDIKCSYLFEACCRGNRLHDCLASLEFLSSCGVRPPCVHLSISPDPDDASPWG